MPSRKNKIEIIFPFYLLPPLTQTLGMTIYCFCRDNRCLLMRKKCEIWSSAQTRDFSKSLFLPPLQFVKFNANTFFSIKFLLKSCGLKIMKSKEYKLKKWRNKFPVSINQLFPFSPLLKLKAGVANGDPKHSPSLNKPFIRKNTENSTGSIKSVHHDLFWMLNRLLL